jgi:hypothetical protein
MRPLLWKATTPKLDFYPSHQVEKSRQPGSLRFCNNLALLCRLRQNCSTMQQRNNQLITLMLILLLAAFMRLDDISKAQAEAYDGGIITQMTLDLVSGESLPAKGIFTSQGIYHPPTMIYLLAIPYAISSHPLFIKMSIALLNVVGVALLMGLARRFISFRVAMIAGLAYAVSPWAMMFSRDLWPNNINTPFLLAGLILAITGFLKQKSWAQMLAVPVFLIVPQIHFSGMALIPLLLWLLWMGRRNISWRAVTLGLVITGIILLPFVLGFNAEDRKNLTSFMLQHEEGEARNYTPHLVSLERAGHLVAGLNLEHQLSKGYFPERVAAAAWRPDALWMTLIVFAVVGALTVWRRVYRWLAALLWMWVGLLALATTTQALYPLYQYIYLMMPALFLLIGIGAEWVSLRHRLAEVGVWVLLAAVFVTQVLWWNGLVDYLDVHVASRFNTPLHYILPVRDDALEYDDVLIVGGGARTDWSVWQPFLYDLSCVRQPFIHGGSVAIFPNHPFAVIYPPDAQANPLDESVRSLYTSGLMTEYPLRLEETPYRIFTFDDVPEWSGPELQPIDPARFEGGMALTGYLFDAGRVYLRWELTPPPQSEPLNTVFTHLLDANGERIGQRDTPFLAGEFWCADDEVITWADLPLADNTSTLRVGIYQIRADGGIVNRNLLDSAGNPAGQWVDISP